MYLIGELYRRCGDYDNAKLWLKFCVEKGFLPQEYLEKIVFYQKQYQEKKLDMDEFMTFFFKALKVKMKIEFHL